MQFRVCSLLAVAMCAPLVPSARAQVAAAPALLNFQGRLTGASGASVPDGSYSIRFSLWDTASGGTAATNEKWSQTVGSVTVKDGVFAVLLSGFPSGVFNSNLWMETKVGADNPMTPRQQMVSVAYAMKANTVPDGSIGAAQIASGAVGKDQLAADAVNNVAWSLSGNNLTDPTKQFLGTSNNNPLIFRGNGVERMRLTAGGNLGIGTTTPAGPLHIVSAGLPMVQLDGSHTIGTWLNLNNTTTGGNNWSLISTGSGSGEGAGNLLLRNTTASRVVLTLLGNGKVGVGTTSPVQTLDVNGGMNLTGGIIQRGGAPLTTTTDLGLYSEVPGNWVRFVTNGGAFQWYADGGTGGTGIMTLSPTGNLTTNALTLLGGADLAEPYHIAPAADLAPAPGMVVAIDPNNVGKLRVADRAYDPSVAGIVSGANGIAPGITLQQKGTVADGNLPVASAGRVWALCDADANGAIRPGDLLTSSDTPGHAMKATDRERRDGAVIGKAMSGLTSGKGLVLVLVGMK